MTTARFKNAIDFLSASKLLVVNNFIDLLIDILLSIRSSDKKRSLLLARLRNTKARLGRAVKELQKLKGLELKTLRTNHKAIGERALLQAEALQSLRGYVVLFELHHLSLDAISFLDYWLWEADDKTFAFVGGVFSQQLTEYREAIAKQARCLNETGFIISEEELSTYCMKKPVSSNPIWTPAHSDKVRLTYEVTCDTAWFLIYQALTMSTNRGFTWVKTLSKKKMSLSDSIENERNGLARCNTLILNARAICPTLRGLARCFAKIGQLTAATTLLKLIDAKSTKAKRNSKKKRNTGATAA